MAMDTTITVSMVKSLRVVKRRAQVRIRDLKKKKPMAKAEKERAKRTRGHPEPARKVNRMALTVRVDQILRIHLMMTTRVTQYTKRKEAEMSKEFDSRVQQVVARRRVYREIQGSTYRMQRVPARRG